MFPVLRATPRPGLDAAARVVPPAVRPDRPVPPRQVRVPQEDRLVHLQGQLARVHQAASSDNLSPPGAVIETEAAREHRLRGLASKLFFTLERQGSRFGLYREADVSRPIRHKVLTLDEVEDILNLWKLRGAYGG